MNLKNLLAEIRLPKAEWIGLREVEETTTTRAMRDGKPTVNVSDTSAGIMLEVLVNGQFAYAALPNLAKTAIQAAAETAFAQAEAASQYPIYRFSSNVRPRAEGRYRSPSRLAFQTHNAGEINDFLAKTCEKMKVSPKVTRTTAVVRMVNCRQRIVSTNGSDIEQDFHLLSTHYGVTAQEGTLVQNRSDGGHMAHSHQIGLEALDDPSLWSRLVQVGEQAVELLSAEECPTLTTSVLLMPDQMMLQIHESIGHPLEIDRILGDERNYAGSSFVKLSDFGTLTYGSPLMNITFDPTVTNEFASYAFDDNGTPAKKEFLIQNGKLLRGLGGIESQTRSKVPGVANARSSLWNRPPIDRMANVNLEPGTASLEEMITSIDHGIMMESNRSWSIDDYRRKFQFGCEYAKLIKNGKIVKTLRNPNYRGITVPFWKNLKMLGSAATTNICGTPNCGKGEPNQVIRVGHASPACVFENIEVFGGAE